MSEIKLALEPRGVFVITLESGQIVKGRFSMHALNRFCEQQKIESYLSLWEKIVLGMTLGNYADLILIALQDYYRLDTAQCPWNVEKIMDDILDPMGGAGSDEFLSLVKHAIGRISPMKEEPAGGNDNIDEKKSL